MIIADLKSLSYHLTQWCSMNTTEQVLKDDEYEIYCGSCGACGEDGCCPATKCRMDGNLGYCRGYLAVLKDAYIELNSIYDFQERLIAVNKELRGIWESY